MADGGGPPRAVRGRATHPLSLDLRRVRRAVRCGPRPLRERPKLDSQRKDLADAAGKKRPERIRRRLQYRTQWKEVRPPTGLGSRHAFSRGPQLLRTMHWRWTELRKSAWRPLRESMSGVLSKASANAAHSGRSTCEHACVPHGAAPSAKSQIPAAACPASTEVPCVSAGLSDALQLRTSGIECAAGCGDRAPARTDGSAATR